MTKIQDVVNSMLEQYRIYGISKNSIESYRNSYCNSIIQFCDRNNDGFYASEVLDDYLTFYKTRLERSEIGATYYSIIARMIRLLKAVGENGIADFSSIHTQIKYDPTQEHWKIADEIIEINNVSHGSVKNLHTQIRHIFCFLEDNSISDTDVTDDDFFKYLSFVSESNKGSRSETMRAVRSVSSYLKDHGAMKLKTDYSLLPFKKAPIHMIEPYSPEEIKKIVEAIDIDSPMGIRDLAIMLLECDTGSRGVDIIHLCQQDIDRRGATLSIRQKNRPYNYSSTKRRSVKRTCRLCTQGETSK